MAILSFIAQLLPVIVLIVTDYYKTRAIKLQEKVDENKRIDSASNADDLLRELSK